MNCLKKSLIQQKWHQPGNNKFSGTQTGIEAIGKMLSEMMGATQGTLVIKPAGAMMVNGNFVSCPVRFSAKSGDKSVEMDGSDLYEVVDGKSENSKVLQTVVAHYFSILQEL